MLQAVLAAFFLGPKFPKAPSELQVSITDNYTD